MLVLAPNISKGKEVILWHSLVGSQAAGVQVALDSLPPPGLAGPCAYAAVTATGTPHCPPTHLPLLQRSTERGKREIRRYARQESSKESERFRQKEEEQIVQNPSGRAIRNSGRKQSRSSPSCKASRCNGNLDGRGLKGADARMLREQADGSDLQGTWADS